MTLPAPKNIANRAKPITRISLFFDCIRSQLLLPVFCSNPPLVKVHGARKNGAMLEKHRNDPTEYHQTQNKMRTRLPLQLVRGTLKRIHTNFTATLILNSLFLVGGLTMLLPPGLSALLHNLTTLGVSLNAMRPHLNRHTHPEQAA